MTVEVFSFVYLTGEKYLSVFGVLSALAAVEERSVLEVSTNLYRLIPRCSYFFGVTGEALFFALVITFLTFLRGLLLKEIVFCAVLLMGVLFLIPFGAKALFLDTF